MLPDEVTMNYNADILERTFDIARTALAQKRLKELSGGKDKPGIRDYLPVGGKSLDIVGPVREDEAFAIARRYEWQARAV